MQVIFIDPVKQEVSKIDIQLEQQQIQNLLGGDFAPIWIVPIKLIGHVGLVVEEGIKMKLQTWSFGEVTIWGPMIITGANETDVKFSVETVEAFVTF